MPSPRALVVLACAFVLIAPPAASQWRSMGTYEPDTVHDVPWMWPGPDTSPGNTPDRIYFNAFPTNLATGINLNAGQTGTRLSSSSLLSWQAFLGVWRDCNRDGYIGLAESALLEYRAELLIDTSVCPQSGDAFASNDGDWIHEFLYVGPVNSSYDFTPGTHYSHVIHSNARVWIDGLLPGQPRPPGAGTCVATPLPEGTTSGTGGMIRYADCFVRIGSGTRVTELANAIDSDGSLGLRFEDPDDPGRSSSRLNVHFPINLFGNPYTGQQGLGQSGTNNPAFTTWDCDRTPVEVHDPTGGDLHRVEVIGPSGSPIVAANLTDDEDRFFWAANPRPAAGDPTGSYADALNHTADGTSLTGSCGEGDSTAWSASYGVVENLGDGPIQSSAQQKGKDQSDVGVFFVDGVAGSAEVRSLLGPYTPFSLGILGPVRWNWGPGWSGDFTYVTTPSQDIMFRDGVLDFDGGRYWTAYASVGPEALQRGLARPTALQGTYGAESCGENDDGVHNGWNCNAVQWYRDADGDDIAAAWDVRVGATYDMRDVDCFDNILVRGVGVYASPVALSTQGPCEDAPMG